MYSLLLYCQSMQNMHFQRDILKTLKKLSSDFPVVTIIGPRQSGKTTLVKMAFPKKAYVNLEELDQRELATLDPRGFLAEYPNGVILDEIQRVPKLLSYIQAKVDLSNQKGIFILTGSHQLELHQAVSQSLAGRTALLNLLPLSLAELTQAKIRLSLDEYILNGFLPRIYKDHLTPTSAYQSYTQTYIERDVRQLINIKDLSHFQRFLKLCAGRIGQVLNVHGLSNDLGISSHTVTAWLSVLEASFIIFKLQPYFENFGKRIIKSPKIYFTDVGLAAYLLDIENLGQIKRDPLRGFLIENLVILELMKTRLNHGLLPQLYYYRDNHQNEIDVIFKSAQQLIPIEIKAAQTFNREFLSGLKYFLNLVTPRCTQGFLVYTGDQEQKIEDFKVLNYRNAAKIVEKSE